MFFLTPKSVLKTFAAKLKPPCGYLAPKYCIHNIKGTLQTSIQITTPLVNLAVDAYILSVDVSMCKSRSWVEMARVSCFSLYSNTPYIITDESIGSEKNMWNAMPR